MPLILKVAITEAVRFDCLAAEGLAVRPNDWVLVRTERFEDLARVTNAFEAPQDMALEALPTVLRQATLQEQSQANVNRAREETLLRTAREKIALHRLPMRVLCTHLTYDQTLVLVVFTAPGRVDFRNLLRDLTRSYSARVELRQVGPRDQAAMVGGLGACGRELCCSTFLTNFVSINVKMAKVQGLSLNPSSVMGACGRLKCCLDFEYESYKSLLKGMPRVGSRCNCRGCDGRVIDANPLAGTVRVALDDDRIVTVPVAELTDHGS